MIDFKVILLIIGFILSVVGIVLNNWKIAAIGELICIVALSDLLP